MTKSLIKDFFKAGGQGQNCRFCGFGPFVWPCKTTNSTTTKSTSTTTRNSASTTTRISVNTSNISHLKSTSEMKKTLKRN
jgi:hypothetical protein